MCIVWQQHSCTIAIKVSPVDKCNMTTFAVILFNYECILINR